MRQLREEAPQRNQNIEDLVSRNSSTDTDRSPPSTTRWGASDHLASAEPYSGSPPKGGNRYCQGPIPCTPARSGGEKYMGNCHGNGLNSRSEIKGPDTGERRVGGECSKMAELDDGSGHVTSGCDRWSYNL